MGDGITQSGPQTLCETSSVIIDQLSSLILLHVTNGSHRYRQYDMTTTMTTTMTMCYYNVLRYFTCRYQGCGRVK